MCGFTGFFTNNLHRTRAELSVIGRAMNDTLAHRGPDSAGLWQDPDVPLILAHQRLAILDLTRDGAQPMVSASGRFVITYNGEIYNHLMLRKELEDAGVAFRGRSDTETLLAAIEFWGLNQTLQKINGMFAFALWDRRAKTLHIARDRLGKKPVYIGWAGGHLVFASELKAFRAHPDFNPVIHVDALSLYMRLGFVPAPYCIYANVWALPPGTRLDLNVAEIAAGTNLTAFMQSYWDAVSVLEDSRNQMQKITPQQAIDSFEDLLSTCVRARMMSDVPLGAFLSGGIDSSTIAALMQKNASAPIKTFTIGFDEQGFNEAPHAKAIAAHLGTDHHELYLSAQDSLNIIPHLPDIYDEPFADFSSIPTFLVSRFARSQVTVALSGDGGDEMLGGYTRHMMGPKIAARMRFMPGIARKALAYALEHTPATHIQKLRPDQPGFPKHIQKLASILRSQGRADLYMRLVNMFEIAPLSNALPAVTPNMLGPLYENRTQYLRLNFAEDMMLWDTLNYLPGDILTKVDRASMGVGLEVRAPLLDKRIYEFVWSLPHILKIQNGQGKWLLRETLKRYVPNSLFERPKQGFSVPIAAWLRSDLRAWGESLLSEQDLKNDGLLDAVLIRKLWEDHQSERADYGYKLWTVLMFRAWQKRWM